MRYEVFTLGKHYLHVHTSKGFSMFANAKLVDGRLSSYTDSMTRRGGSWVIDVWKFLNKKDFPVNPIYTAVFGFADDDTEVQVTPTDIDVESISGVNGQLVDIGNISLPVGQSLAVNSFFGRESSSIYVEYNDFDEPLNLPDLTMAKVVSASGFLTLGGAQYWNLNNYKTNIVDGQDNFLRFADIVGVFVSENGSLFVRDEVENYFEVRRLRRSGVCVNLTFYDNPSKVLTICY